MRLILPSLLFLISCQDLNSNSSDRSLYGDTDAAALNDDNNARFLVAYPIIKARCASCHTSPIHNKWAAYKSSEWQNEGTIAPGDSDASTFITRIKNYGPTGDMPQDTGSIPDDEFESLVDWVDNL
jgi:hypothetical protein